MTEYYGFDIDEECEGQFDDLVAGVDPLYHKAIACGLSFLCQDYGDKAYRQLDSWFSAIYATVMEMEEVIDRVRAESCEPSNLDFSMLAVKDD
jgi:hypothetical protein